MTTARRPPRRPPPSPLAPLAAMLALTARPPTPAASFVRSFAPPVRPLAVRAGDLPLPLARADAPAAASTGGAPSSTSLSSSSSAEIEDEYDVLIVGSGVGGLSAAALLSHYGSKVAVFESHYAPGGAAHGYSVRSKEANGGEFRFDTGPSFFSGLNPKVPPKSSNPLRTLLDLIDEEVECLPYETFGLLFPEGAFVHSPKFGSASSGSLGVIESVAGEEGVAQWTSLMEQMDPLSKAVDAVPTLALRADWGVALTAGRFLPNFAKLNPLENLKLTEPFSKVVASAGVEDAFVKNWLDVLCFCLSGVPSDGTITAEMAMMMGEFYDDDAVMDCPVGGAKGVVDALVRGIEKNGGKVFLKSHVEEIVVEDGKAEGVRLRKDPDRIIEAKEGVISNLSTWDLLESGIVDPSHFPERFVEERRKTPMCPSFMHLHVGFEMSREELEGLQAHYINVDDWTRGVEAEENCALVSIPSVHDDTLAPRGYGVLHAYTPATERYDRWANLKRGTKEYEALKEERSQFLWKTLEKIIPDVRQRAAHVQVGTPLTHARFLNRRKGTYGPAIRADEGSFPFPNTPVKGLLQCGDSCFPGIGVPAACASGTIAANSVTLGSVGKQVEALREVSAAAG